MTWVLIVVSLYGGVRTVPMSSEENCTKAASVLNDRLTVTAKGFCVKP